MPQNTLTPDYHFLEQVETIGPFQASACYQCRKCTNGCPVTFAMDIHPDAVIRLVILGQREAAEASLGRERDNLVAQNQELQRKLEQVAAPADDSVVHQLASLELQHQQAGGGFLDGHELVPS